MPNHRQPRSSVSRLCVFSLAALFAASVSHADEAAKTAVDETQMTVAAVTALEQHWTRAEESGDDAWLEQMLLPEFRSITPEGVAHPKAAIVAGAKKNRGSDATRLADEAYRKAHPYGTSVVLQGDLAIVSFYDPVLGAQKGVRSSDIFVYRDGHWHAIYSQHSNAEKR